MLWGYVQLDDGTQFAYSETREDGSVRVCSGVISKSVFCRILPDSEVLEASIELKFRSIHSLGL